MGRFTTTTAAICRAIPNSEECLGALAKRYGFNQKTVAKWKQRTSVANLPNRRREARSTILTLEEEAIIVAFRNPTLLPLDDFCPEPRRTGCVGDIHELYPRLVAGAR